MWLPYIKLENYKLFKKQTFEFARITLLTGKPMRVYFDYTSLPILGH